MNYFKKTEYISNSQLRSFVSFNKWWERIYTPEKYRALYIDKTMKFQVNDAIITWKIVDRYFDGEKEKVWEEYKVKARRTKEDKATEKVITWTMKEEAETMIEYGNNFKQLQDFISLKDTKAQKEYFKEVELMDKEWEIFKIKIKWVFDFFNEKEKKIVDLKTWWDYSWALAVIDTNGVKWIEISNEILNFIWEDMKKDIYNFWKEEIEIEEFTF